MNMHLKQKRIPWHENITTPASLTTCGSMFIFPISYKVVFTKYYKNKSTKAFSKIFNNTNFFLVIQ